MRRKPRRSKKGLAVMLASVRSRSAPRSRTTDSSCLRRAVATPRSLMRRMDVHHVQMARAFELDEAPAISEPAASATHACRVS